MTIVSSIVSQQSQQKDGRIWVFETHTDQLGVSYFVIWLCPVGTSVTSLLTIHANNIWNNLVINEIANNLKQVSTLGLNAVVTFNYSTVAANIAALRAAYLTATQDQVIFTGEYLNSLSSAQLQSAFGLTAGQVTTLQTTKLQPAATIAASIRASQGA